MDDIDSTLQGNAGPGGLITALPVLPIGHGGRQRGIIAPLAAVAMLGLIGMAGLAVDLGHAYLNRTRLQNALDAAALSGAKTLDETGDTGLATAAAQAAFTRNADAGGNAELKNISADAVGIGYSATLDPFAPGSAPARFVRVAVDSFSRPSWLIQVLGFPNKTVGGAAVAGPSPVLKEVCDLLPVAPCGDPPTPESPLFGYTEGKTYPLKTGSGTQGWEVGPGNYQNIQLSCGTGGDCVREEMSGEYSGCVTLCTPEEAAANPEQCTTTTQPGDKAGPNAQGLNTRFNCLGPDGKKTGGCKITDTALPDVVVDAGGAGFPDTYTDYKKDYAEENWDIAEPNGKKDRRRVQVPVIDCKGTTNGAGKVKVLGVACFFLTSPAEHNGQQTVYGEFYKDCEGSGTPGLNPVVGPGPHTIILYKDFTDGNVDS